MASHAAFELDFYRQTAVVFSHNLDPAAELVAWRVPKGATITWCVSKGATFVVEQKDPKPLTPRPVSSN